MTNAIILTNPTDNLSVMLSGIDAGSNKDQRSRLSLYTDWLNTVDGRWYTPDLAAYVQYAMSEDRAAGPLSPSTMQVHLSTIRSQYRRLMRNRDVFFAAMPDDMPFTEQKAFVDEAIQRIKDQIDPDHVKISVEQHQDRADSDHLRLTQAQANSLLRKPDVNTLIGLRDLALIALTLCTGVREAEAANLVVSDLRQQLGGELALHVRQGKGNKSRLVPYGELDWCLVIVERWLQHAGISTGPVFRGFYKGGFRMRRTPLTERSIQRVLDAYPISIDGSQRTVKPHDLRRTYARRLYEAGMELVAIQQNLGHSDIKTTLGYIGALDVGKRRAKAVYDYDLEQLPEKLG